MWSLRPQESKVQAGHRIGPITNSMQVSLSSPLLLELHPQKLSLLELAGSRVSKLIFRKIMYMNWNTMIP